MQAWAAMEEEIGALQRATELRSYRMQGINDVVLPANFGISLSQEPADSPLKAVANTVRSDTSSLPKMLFLHGAKVILLCYFSMYLPFLMVVMLTHSAALCLCVRAPAWQDALRVHCWPCQSLLVSDSLDCLCLWLSSWT